MCVCVCARSFFRRCEGHCLLGMGVWGGPQWWASRRGRPVVLGAARRPYQRTDVYFALSTIRLDTAFPRLKGVLMACCEFSCARSVCASGELDLSERRPQEKGRRGPRALWSALSRGVVAKNHLPLAMLFSLRSGVEGRPPLLLPSTRDGVGVCGGVASGRGVAHRYAWGCLPVRPFIAHAAAGGRGMVE